MLKSNINLLYGEEKYLLEQFVANVKENVSLPEINLNLFEGLEEVNEIIAAGQQVPFCSDKKVIIVTSDFKKVPDILLEFMKQLPSTTNLVLLSMDKVDRRTKFYKTVKKLGSITEFNKLYERQLIDFITNECKLRNANIDLDSALLLIYRTGYLQKEKTDVNLYTIVNYIEKLTNYTKTITTEIVEKLVEESAEENVFKLMDMLTSNISNAFRYSQGLIENNNNPLGLIALITRHFRILMKLNLVDDPKVLELHPFVLSNMKAQMKVYPKHVILMILSECLNAQKNIKNGAMPSGIALDNLLAYISAYTTI